MILVSPKGGTQLIGNSALRCPETVRTYHVGRYADPNNESLMHERNEVYRVEASARWNLYPDSYPVAPPALPSRDLAFFPAPVSDEILAEVNSQKLATTQITGEAKMLTASLVEFQTALQQAKTNLQETAALRAVLKNLERRLDVLESAQRQLPSITQETNDAKISFPTFVPVP